MILNYHSPLQLSGMEPLNVEKHADDSNSYRNACQDGNNGCQQSELGVSTIEADLPEGYEVNSITEATAPLPAKGS